MYILGINTSHDSSVCLLKDGEVVFYIEDERMIKIKDCCYEYESPDEVLCAPSIKKVKEYTEKVDYIVFSSFGRDPKLQDEKINNRILNKIISEGIDFNTSIFFHENHHLYHAASAFYGSGFDDAVALIMDGGGSYPEISNNEYDYPFREVESIYDCGYDNIKPLHKHYSILDFIGDEHTGERMIFDKTRDNEVFSRSLSCGDLFTRICEFLKLGENSAGKLMGLSGHHNKKAFDEFVLARLFDTALYGENNAQKICKRINYLLESKWFYECRGEWITIPNLTHDLREFFNLLNLNLETHKHSMDFFAAVSIADKLQEETYEHTCRLIEKSITLSGKKKVVLSGGYFMNCVNNYKYTKRFPEIEFFVDPIPHDGGTSIGAAKYLWYCLTKSNKKYPYNDVYFGPK